MVYGPISAVTNNKQGNIDTSQSASLNNSQISALLTSGNVDPKFATVLMNQMTTNNINSILFSDDNESSSSDFLGADLLGNTSSNNDSLSSTFGMSGTSGTNNIGSLQGVPMEFQMTVYSTLIGKSVTAVDPSTNTQVTGAVKSVQLQNGQVMIDINGTIIPAQNLLKIK